MLAEAERTLGLRRYKEAKRLYLAALQAGQPSSECKQGLCVASYHLHEFGEAENYARAAIEADPRAYIPHLYLAYIHARRADLDGAGEWVQRAIELVPLRPEAHAFGGGVRLAQRRLDEAEAMLVEAQRLGAEDWIYHGNVGQLHLRMNRHNLALGELWASFREHPSAWTLRPMASLVFLKYWRLIALGLVLVTYLAVALHSVFLLLLSAVPVIALGAIGALKGHRKGLLVAFAGIIPVVVFWLQD